MVLSLLAAIRVDLVMAGRYIHPDSVLKTGSGAEAVASSLVHCYSDLGCYAGVMPLAVAWLD